jgi:hypothetical protein
MILSLVLVCAPSEMSARMLSQRELPVDAGFHCLAVALADADLLHAGAA